MSPGALLLHVLICYCSQCQKFYHPSPAPSGQHCKTSYLGSSQKDSRVALMAIGLRTLQLCLNKLAGPGPYHSKVTKIADMYCNTNDVRLQYKHCRHSCRYQKVKMSFHNCLRLVFTCTRVSLTGYIQSLALASQAIGVHVSARRVVATGRLPGCSFRSFRGPQGCCQTTQSSFSSTPKRLWHPAGASWLDPVSSSSSSLLPTSRNVTSTIARRWELSRQGLYIWLSMYSMPFPA